MMMSPAAIEADNGISKAGCMAHHLEEAIAFNGQRAAQYEAWGGAQARRVSAFLVATEKASLALAKIQDWRAAVIQRFVPSFMCAEFVPMSLAPAQTFPKVPAGPRSAFDSRPLSEWTESQVRMRHVPFIALTPGLHAAFKRAAEGLHARDPNQNCMTRHVLESLARAAVLWPRHADALDDAGAPRWVVRTAERIARQNVRQQLVALRLAKIFDDAAWPLQAEGIGIVCDDVPPIPMDLADAP